MSGVSQAYKGDVSEVLMGHETGIYLQHGEPCTWRTIWSASNPDYTTLFFEGTGGANTIFETNPILKVPLGMLIGQTLTFHKAGSPNNFSDFYNDGFNSRNYRIVDHTVESNATYLKIVPALEHTTSTRLSAAGDALFIHSLGMPTLSASDFAHDDAADASQEVSTIDQFIGLASHMVLPDTTVELLRHHVVGLGRQAAIQQTGKVHHQGGQLEMPLHNPRWLYYSLGREVVDAETMTGAQGYNKAGTLRGPITPGQTYADVDDLDFNGHTLAVGDYVLFPDTTLVPTVYYKAVEGSGTQYWPSSDAASTLSSDSHHFDQARSSEIRRVVAIEEVSGDYRLFLDDPIYYEHESSDGVQAFRLRGGRSSPTNLIFATRGLSMRRTVSRSLLSRPSMSSTAR